MRLAAELLGQYVAYRFLPYNEDFTVEDYLACRNLMLDAMVGAGEITEAQRDRVSFSRWMTRDEDAATRRRTAEAEEWAPSPEAAAVAPPVDEPRRHGDVDDLLAEAERHRKLTRPIDELWPPTPGDSLSTDYYYL